MRHRKIHVTPKQADRLFDDVQALPTASVGEHLSDDQFIDYSMTTLTPDEMNEVDRHLASCTDCAIEMERMLEGSGNWDGEQGERRLAELRVVMQSQFSALRRKNALDQSVSSLRPIEKSLQNLFEPNEESLQEERLAWAAETKTEMVRKIWAYEESQSGVQGQGFLDSNGDLVLVLSSKHMELQGLRLHLRIGSDEGETAQEQVFQANESKTEVGVTFVVPRYALPQGGAQVFFYLEEAES